MKTGIELIAAERQRQIEVEGWDSEHDDDHIYCEMVSAAVCYCFPSCKDQFWPREWLESWFKTTPHDRVRDLTKAGALIAAEIDRLQRARAVKA